MKKSVALSIVVWALAASISVSAVASNVTGNSASGGSTGVSAPTLVGTPGVGGGLGQPTDPGFTPWNTYNTGGSDADGGNKSIPCTSTGCGNTGFSPKLPNNASH
jgi:hypothetical protein